MNRPSDVDVELYNDNVPMCVRLYIADLERRVTVLRGNAEHLKDRNRALRAQVQTLEGKSW